MTQLVEPITSITIEGESYVVDNLPADIRYLVDLINSGREKEAVLIAELHEKTHERVVIAAGLQYIQTELTKALQNHFGVDKVEADE